MKKIHVLNDNEKTNVKLYLLEENADGERRPLILICPGGAYLDCSDNEGEPVALKFNSFGFHTAVLTYSTLSSKADCTCKDALNDLAETVRWLNENAASLGVDPERIFLMGFSAGAHLCALYANRHAKDRLKVSSCILGYGLLDTMMFAKDALKMIEKEEEADLEQVTGARNRISFRKFLALCNTAMYHTADPDEETLKESSPVEHIHPDSPPCFIWTTFEDDLLNPLQSIQYAKRLYENGVRCELHMFPYGRHGWSLFDETSAKSEKEINAHTAKWAELAAEWIRSLGE